jgi:ATP-dependent RNA helicase DDX51/DBP6
VLTQPLVQTALLPELAGLPLVPHPDEFLHDYLVSAPTGSGKTLSYVVPLIEVSIALPRANLL